MRRLVRTIVAAALLTPGAAFAVTEDDFVVRNAQDIVDICDTPKTDPLYTAAANFCQGYLVGAYAYHRALYSQPGRKDPVCLPEPPPTRTAAIEAYVAWLKANPKYLDENAVEALVKFMTEDYACAKKGKAG